MFAMEDHGSPFVGSKLRQLEQFLLSGGLRYDSGIQFTINLLDESRDIIATGSLQDNIIKCVLVDPAYQGEGLTAKLLTALMNRAAAGGHSHLFLFTKPANVLLFADFGFYEVAGTRDVLLMENTRDGIARFVAGLECPTREGNIGAVVCNCNPFTLGHQYLIETASARCDLLHVFVLSAERSEFPAEARMRMVREGTAHLENVVVHPTADYLISSATFPDYFLKEKADAAAVNTTLDLTIFRERFARPMGITTRFVGTEPNSAVTNAYNQQMAAFFRDTEIAVVEIPRKECEGEAISATRVRALLREGRESEAYVLIPATTRCFLKTPTGREIIARMQK